MSKKPDIDALMERVRERHAHLSEEQKDERAVAFVSATPTISADRVWDWDTQAAQYPDSGPPGLSFMASRHTSGVLVNCLLHRGEAGDLDGILNHYGAEIPGVQAARTTNIWVRPDRQGQGIGTEMALTAAAAGWQVDVERVQHSAAGHRLTSRIAAMFRPEAVEGLLDRSDAGQAAPPVEAD